MSAPNPTAPIPVCVPGKDGIPGSFLGHLLCGDLGKVTPQTTGLWLHTWWPALAGGLLALVAVRLGWALARRQKWRANAAQARWLEIVPPVSAYPAATAELWTLLAQQLPTPGRFTLYPRRLAFEVHATGERTRVGIWVPPGISVLAVTQAIQRAWSGAKVTEAVPPRLPDELACVGRIVAPAQPEWLPFTEAPTAGRGDFGTHPESDRLRAVFDALASAGRTGGALLQVVVGRAPRSRIAVLRLATRDPGKARRKGTARGIGLLAAALSGVLRLVVNVVEELVSTGHRRTPRTPSGVRPIDPYAAELSRAARGKYADVPHLVIGVRVITCGPTQAAAKAAIDGVMAGFALVSAVLGRRRLARPREAARWRSVRTQAMTLATTSETAAVAGLPAEPAAYGLPAAGSCHRRGTAETWRTDRTGKPDPQSGPTGPGDTDPDPDAPGDSPDPWSFL